MTGGLVAHAVEPAAGGPTIAGGHGVCLNCGTALIGSHCHHCGQSGHVHRSIGAIGHDIAHGVFHFEGKIWRTLPMLAFRPGALTRRYVQGERARFVSPLALFLFTVFLMFATINTFGGHLETGDVDSARAAALRADFTDQLAVQRRGVANAERALRETQAQGRSTTAIERDLATRREMVKGLELASAGAAECRIPRFSNVDTGWAKLDEGIAKANENPNLALYKVQSSAYKFSWALIPISVPFLWLMFAWHRRRHVYDHAIFVTYSLSFMSLLVIVLTGFYLLGAPGGLIWTAAIVIPPVHIYAQLRGAYEIGRFGALVRTVLLLIFASIALLLFLLLLLGLGLLA